MKNLFNLKMKPATIQEYPEGGKYADTQILYYDN